MISKYKYYKYYIIYIYIYVPITSTEFIFGSMENQKHGDSHGIVQIPWNNMKTSSEEWDV